MIPSFSEIGDRLRFNLRLEDYTRVARLAEVVCLIRIGHHVKTERARVKASAKATSAPIPRGWAVRPVSVRHRSGAASSYRW